MSDDKQTIANYLALLATQPALVPTAVTGAAVEAAERLCTDSSSEGHHDDHEEPSLSGFLAAARPSRQWIADAAIMFCLGAAVAVLARIAVILPP